MPVLVGSFFSSCVKASRPPAEAPTPTMGNKPAGEAFGADGVRGGWRERDVGLRPRPGLANDLVRRFSTCNSAQLLVGKTSVPESCRTAAPDRRKSHRSTLVASARVNRAGSEFATEQICRTVSMRAKPADYCVVTSECKIIGAVFLAVHAGNSQFPAGALASQNGSIVNRRWTQEAASTGCVKRPTSFHSPRCDRASVQAPDALGAISQRHRLVMSVYVTPPRYTQPAPRGMG